MPESNDEVRVTVRLPANLHQQITAAATTDRHSLNAEIVTLLEWGLETHYDQPRMDAYARLFEPLPGESDDDFIARQRAAFAAPSEALTAALKEEARRQLPEG